MMHGKRKVWRLAPAAALVLAMALGGPVWAADTAAGVNDRETQGGEEGTVDLEPVRVQDAQVKDGSAEAGYLVEDAQQVGPWKDLPLQDTPYTFTVVPQEILANVAAGQGSASLNQLFKILPGVYTNGTNGGGAPGSGSYNKFRNGVQRAFARGFLTSVRVDGMQANDYSIGTLENVERVEQMNGFSGFMYGVSDLLGGTTNYVLKRPTDYFYNKLTIGGGGGDNMYLQGDFGGPLLDGKFGYRINFIGTDGELARNGLGSRNKGFSAAVDWHVTDDLLFQFDTSFKEEKSWGWLVPWDALSKDFYLSPPDNKKSFGQEWAFNEVKSSSYGLRLLYEPTDYLTIRSAYRWSKVHPKGLSLSYYPYLWEAIAGGTTTDLYYQAQDMNPRYNKTGNLYVDLEFETFGVEHKLTTGFMTDVSESWSAPYVYAAGVVQGVAPGQPVKQPGDIGALFDSLDHRYRFTGKSRNTQIMIGDQITFNEHWMLLMGVTNARVHNQGFSWDTGRETSHYKTKAWTPNYSLVFKPIEELSLYATYIEALENGQNPVPEQGDVDLGFGPETWPFTNAREVLPAQFSESYEFGAKWALNPSVLLSAAFYHLDKSNDSVQRNDADKTLTWLRGGRQVHQGLDVSIVGKVTDRLTLFGGVTTIDAKLEKMDYRRKNEEGQRPGNVPEVIAKIYAEYELPWVDGLTVTGGAFYSGKRHASSVPADDWVMGGHTLYDLGLRYETEIKGVETTFNLYVQNLTNKPFYTSTYGLVGDPRAITFSTSFEF